MTVSTATPPAYRDPNVLRWVAAYTASVTGDVMFFLTLSWAVTRIAGPAQVGLVLAIGALPRAMLMLGGGVLADRLGPRRVVIGSDLARCVIVLTAAAAIFLAEPGLWALVLLALVFGVIDALFMPAVGALPARITNPGQLGRVQGLRTLAVRSSNAVGPLIAAVVLTAGGVPAGFAVIGVLFSASVALLLAVRETPAQAVSAGSAWADLRDGLRYLRRHRELTRLVIVIGLSELCFSGPVGIGLVLLTTERQWSAAVLGWTLSAFSIGGAAAGLLLTASPRVPKAGLVLTGSLVSTALLIAVLGQTAVVALVIAESAVLGVVSGIAMAVSNALLQRQTSPAYLGRVSSVTSLCTLGLSPLLYPLVGLVAAAWGTGVFFAGCAVVCLLAAAAAVSVREPR